MAKQSSFLCFKEYEELGLQILTENLRLFKSYLA